MGLHESFLQPIIEAPDDDSPRLIYADWLEENGDLARAEFIRVQCRLAAADENAPERRELRWREYELLADHGGKWAGPLVGRVRRWRFRRGFVEQVKLEAGQFLKEARWLLDFAPIRELEVQHPTLEELRPLLASKHIRRITRLNLDHARLGDAGASLLAESPSLARLQRLSLQFNEIGSAGLRALAGSPHLRSLRSIGLFELRSNQRDGDRFASLVSACRLPSLHELEWQGAIGPAGVRTLAASSAGRPTDDIAVAGGPHRPGGVASAGRVACFHEAERVVHQHRRGDSGVRRRPFRRTVPAAPHLTGVVQHFPQRRGDGWS